MLLWTELTESKNYRRKSRQGGVVDAVSYSMGHRDCNPPMPKATILVVLLLVLNIPVFSSARLVLDNLSSVTPRRGLSEHDKPGTVMVDLMHVQHVDSPYMQPNLTLLQRAQNAAMTSKQRLSYFSNKMYGKTKTFGVSYVSFSSVFSVQGAYVMQISAGSPASTFSVIVDTGSDLVWLQSSPCTRCFQEPDPVFQPSSSSTYAPMSCTQALCNDLPPTGPYPACATDNTCVYEYTYGDQSFTKGTMAYETFTFASTDGSQRAFRNVGFGCGNDNGGTLGSRPIDGLVGLGNGPLSLISQLGSAIGPVFSYCLVSYASATSKTSPLLLGSAGSLTLSYTPLIVNSFNPIARTFYYVNLVGITVNGKAVQYPSGTFDIDATTGNGGFILDSGTTVTQLYDAAYTPFKDAISGLISYPLVSATGSGFDLCYDTSSVATPVFPAVVFQFEKVDLVMPSDNVFVAADDQGTYCMFISGTGPNAAVGIFGNVQQQNFQIAYDIVNSRIGFAPTTC